MINIENAITALDSYLHCIGKSCDNCRAEYGVDYGCPTDKYKYEMDNICQALKKILTAPDSNIEITEDELIEILTKENVF